MIIIEVLSPIASFSGVKTDEDFLICTYGLLLYVKENDRIIYYSQGYEAHKEYYDRHGYYPWEKTSAVTDLKVDDARSAYPRYYNLMGIPFDTKPTVPGIYIHQGRKVVVK